MRILILAFAMSGLAACGVAHQVETRSGTGAKLASMGDAEADRKAIVLPAKDLLAAARRIKAQTGPYYSVVGTLVCKTVSREVPPYSTTTTCVLSFDGRSESVAHAEADTRILATVRAPTGPYTEWRGTVRLTSVSQEVPPYAVSESALLELDRGA